MDSMSYNEIIQTTNPNIKLRRDYKSRLTEEVSIRLYNIQGRLLLIKEFSNQNLMEVELSGFKDGIYLAKIQTKAGNETRKIVIQN